MGQRSVGDYKAYYAQSLESGLAYQDFVVDAAWSMLGLAIVQYGSRLYQQNVGESRTGVEIKFDRKFKDTGNLWIEGGEKAYPRDGEYVPSGIFRNDNTWLYCIGDYDTVFFFGKRLLKGMWNSGRYEIKENHTRTSRGFLLHRTDAEKYALMVLRPNSEEKIASMIADMESTRRSLYALAQCEQTGQQYMQLPPRHQPSSSRPRERVK